jgi:hypothetical protein
MPAPVDSPEREAEQDRGLLAAHFVPLPPPAQAGTNVLRLEAECQADAHEREGPDGVVRGEPLFHVAGETTGAPTRGRDTLLIRPDGLLEHGQHEALFGLEGRIDVNAREELRRQNRLRLHSRCVVPRVPRFRAASMAIRASSLAGSALVVPAGTGYAINAGGTFI